MGSLFKRPKPEAPARMPDAEDPRVREAEDRRRREIAARSGRQSTILTRRSSGSGGNSAGQTGDAYRNSLLGQS